MISFMVQKLFSQKSFDWLIINLKLMSSFFFVNVAIKMSLFIEAFQLYLSPKITVLFFIINHSIINSHFVSIIHPKGFAINFDYFFFTQLSNWTINYSLIHFICFHVVLLNWTILNSMYLNVFVSKLIISFLSYWNYFHWSSIYNQISNILLALNFMQIAI